jgi:hypothetical protein
MNYGYNGAFQSAIDGYARMALSPYIPNSTVREYLIGQLSEPLTIGEQYYVRMKVKPSVKQCYAINNLGLLFTNIYYSSDTLPYQYQNIAHVNYTGIVTDTANWTSIEGFFTADSAYNYLLIGNFFDTAYTNTMVPWEPCSNSNNNFAYYFIDDVCVTKDSSTCNIISNLKEVNYVNNETNIYPNPVNEILYFKSENNIFLKVELYNYSGKLIYSKVNPQNRSINFSNYSNGIYFIKLIENDNFITKKVIKY